MRRHFLMKHFLADGLAMVDQYLIPQPSVISRNCFSSCVSRCRIMLPYYGWPCNPSCKDSIRNPKCGERNVNLYMGRTSLLAWLGFPLLRSSKASINVFELWNNLHRLHIAVCFGFDVINVQYRIRTLWKPVFFFSKLNSSAQNRPQLLLEWR